MHGGSLPIASKKRKSNKIATSEAIDEGEASEPKKKKAKRAKDALQVQTVGSEMPTIQDEVQDLEPAKILDRRTRSGISIGTSQSLPPQSSTPKKKSKRSIRKLKVSTYVREEDEEIQASIYLVTREVKRKKAAVEAALERALEIAEQTNIPAEVLLKESSGEQAQKVVELAENLQELVVASDLLKTTEETQGEEATCSEAVANSFESNMR